MIIRIIICDYCGKKEDLDNPYRKKWFIEAISKQYCSEECFEKVPEKFVKK